MRRGGKGRGGGGRRPRAVERDDDPAVQKRLKQIADFLLEEIDRDEQSPLEEFTTHTATMIHILQFLNIEEAYHVSIASPRIYAWFQKKGIWQALAQRWLSPERYTQVWQWADRNRPEGGYINYLWLLLAEYGASGKGYLVVYYGRRHDYSPLSLGFMFNYDGSLTYNQGSYDSPFNTYLQKVHPDRRSEYGRFRLVYRTFVDYPEAVASFEYREEGWSPFREPTPDERTMIRKPLSTY